MRPDPRRRFCWRSPQAVKGSALASDGSLAGSRRRRRGARCQPSFYRAEGGAQPRQEPSPAGQLHRPQPHGDQRCIGSYSLMGTSASTFANSNGNDRFRSALKSEGPGTRCLSRNSGARPPASILATIRWTGFCTPNASLRNSVNSARPRAEFDASQRNFRSLSSEIGPHSPSTSVAGQHRIGQHTRFGVGTVFTL